MLWQDYHLPTSVGEALSLLAAYNGEARVVAGGTDLILELQQGHRPPVKALVDVTRIAGANEIRREGEHIVIGCGVTHTQIVESPLIQQHGTALAEGCGVIGGPQVRNVATLAGNVAHALPAGDGTISLLALGGEAQVARRKTQDANEIDFEWIPLEKLYLGPGKSLVDSTCEMISALRFVPTSEGEASAFARIMRPQGVALPILGMATRLTVERRSPGRPHQRANRRRPGRPYPIPRLRHRRVSPQASPRRTKRLKRRFPCCWTNVTRAPALIAPQRSTGARC